MPRGNAPVAKREKRQEGLVDNWKYGQFSPIKKIGDILNNINKKNKKK